VVFETCPYVHIRIIAYFFAVVKLVKEFHKKSKEYFIEIPFKNLLSASEFVTIKQKKKVRSVTL